MNEDLKLYYERLFEHENYLPHAQQTEHIEKRTIINKNQKYIIERNGITYQNTLPLIDITYGSCPECDCKTYSYDQWRGEKVCPQCGLVLEEGLAQQPYYSEAYRKPKTTLTWEEKNFLKNYGHYKYLNNSKDWLNNITNKTIKSLTGQAQLNKQQQMETKYILDVMGFKKLHSRATKSQIISAVIRYVLKRSKTTPALLRYNCGIFKDNLTPEVYNKVEENINKYFTNLKQTTNLRLIP